jgi:hypothetical protein
MFAAANTLARGFTFPMIVSSRRRKGSVDVAVCAFTVLNREGWIVTAAHIFQLAAAANADAPKVVALRERIAAIEGDASLSPRARARELEKAEGAADPEWVTHNAYWLGRDGVTLRDIKTNAAADIAVGRLDPVPPDLVVATPIFKNPASGILPGTSLCRLGFAFTKVKSTFDEPSGGFRVKGEVRYFPLEGMFTRIVEAGKKADGSVAARFIETSSPGLRGQSGGPLFDSQGRIWGIQSRTQHLALGFNPEIEIAGTRTTVPQFINLGLATHVGTLIGILDELGVAHDVSPD